MRVTRFETAIRLLTPVAAWLLLTCLPLAAAPGANRQVRAVEVPADRQARVSKQLADDPIPAVEEPAEDNATAVPVADSRALERARPRSEWGPHAESRIYGLAYIEEDEPDGMRLRGISLLWSNWDETVDFNGGLGWWLSWQDGDRQTIYGGGFEATWLPWVPQAPVRFGPRLRLGLEHRSDAPDDGLGGLAAAGLELGFWIGDRFQIALIADREWPFHAAARTQLGVSLRYARRRY